MEQSLNGIWRLYYHAESGLMPETPEALHAAGWPSIQARVPGNVELDLVAAGLAPEPFWNENIYAYRPYEIYQWWYETSFTAPRLRPSDRLRLVFEGIDLIADIFINGNPAGHTENMLVEHAFDITDFINPAGKNTLHVKISSAINHARKQTYPAMVTTAVHADEYTMLRKPPHCFGWDIMPRLLSAGLWRGVSLRTEAPTRMTEVYYATKWVSADSACLVYRFRFAADDHLLDGFSYTLSGICGDSAFSVTHPVRFVSDGGEVVIPNPRLWWPKGYGAPDLYTVRMTLCRHGQPVDTREDTIGLRRFHIEHRLLPGDAGAFRITVNGCPVFAKGSNWVPLDALHSRDAGRLDRALDLFEEAGCNIVRCWGGNVYEDHAFFDRCDQSGLMVWQDFAMACALYPQTDAFFHEIEEEAAKAIRKLRNHASLLLWAGDNEVDEAYSAANFATEENKHNAVTREVLARAVRTHDPYRLFLPSSPCIPAGIARYDVPEQHNWGARAYFKDDFYKNSAAHFVSECGYHGCPSPDTLRAFIPEEELWPVGESGAWTTHSTANRLNAPPGYDRNKLMANQVRLLFGQMPQDIDTFSALSQISQAEAKKFFIERARVKKWRRTGIIWWNMLDGWPQISDAVVDYFFRKKRAFDYICRSQRPVCLMMDELQDWTHAVVLGNDGMDDVQARYEVRDGDNGEVLLRGARLSKANQNDRVGEVRVMPGEKRLFLLNVTIGETTFGNHYITGFPPYDAQTMLRWASVIDRLD